MGGKPKRSTPADQRLKRNNPQAGIPLAKRNNPQAGTGQQRANPEGSIANPKGSTINVREGNQGRPK